MQLVLASRNASKIREIRSMLSDLPILVQGLGEVGPVPEVEEDGATYEANAAKKALTAAQMLGTWALADDSGLEVDALGGDPGVNSARYAPTDPERIRKLLKAMAGTENDRRRARFVAVFVLAGPEGVVATTRGECEGLITEEPRGSNGFGYDPVFLYPQAGRTFAELTAREKNAVSHRYRALEKMHEVLRSMV